MIAEGAVLSEGFKSHPIGGRMHRLRMHQRKRYLAPPTSQLSGPATQACAARLSLPNREPNPW